VFKKKEFISPVSQVKLRLGFNTALEDQGAFFILFAGCKEE
jgi:hypothetical protein